MSGNLCEYRGCGRARFENKTKCIFHCEKDDWFETVETSQPWETRNWSKSQNKADYFWTEFKKEWREGKFDYPHFVFPKFEKDIFQNLYQKYLKLPNDQYIVFFNYAKFLDDAEFSDIIFTQSVLFNNVTFTQSAYFSNAIFKRGTEFNNATFTQWAHFYNATFTQWAHFYSATFTGEADFSVDAAFDTKGVYGKAIPTFGGDASFAGASFGGETTFENREFKDETSFANAKFARAPNMHGAELYSNTDFTGISCGTAEPNKSHGYYRLLKEKMEGTGDRRAASLFYAAEQHCLLNTGDLGEVETVISWFYKSASYYGSNIHRPLGWLWGFQMLFPFLFFKFNLPLLPASPHSPFYFFINYLVAIVILDGLVFYFFVRNSKDVEGSAIIGKVPIILAISFNIVVALCIDDFTWKGYGDNWIMLLTNLFRPFYGWNEPPSTHGLSDYLIGLLHLTLMYSAFALLLFAIRRRFKME